MVEGDIGSVQELDDGIWYMKNGVDGWDLDLCSILAIKCWALLLLDG